MKRLMRSLLRSQFLVFLVVGGFNTLFGYLLFAMLFHVGQLHYNGALLIAYAVGVFLSYATHKRFTFRQSRHADKSLPKYIGSYAVIFIINTFLLTVLVELLSLDPLIGQMIAILVMTMLTFFVQKYWVFAASHDRK